MYAGKTSPDKALLWRRISHPHTELNHLSNHARHTRGAPFLQSSGDGVGSGLQGSQQHNHRCAALHGTLSRTGKALSWGLI